MSFELHSQLISVAAFVPFGDLISTEGAPDTLINQGLCGRFHDRARLDFGDGRAGVSLEGRVPGSLGCARRRRCDSPEPARAQKRENNIYNFNTQCIINK